MEDCSTGLERFEQLRTRLTALIDEDPERAIEEARSLSSEIPFDGVLFGGLKAAVLVDAGVCAGNKPAITEGVDLFVALLKTSPDDPNVHYNVGNGLVAIADVEKYEGVEWYLSTAETRRQARKHFRRAISLDHYSSVASVALTNLGNVLWKAHRWAEAYDAYSEALEHDSTNGVASTGAAKVLLRCVNHGIGDAEVLRAVAARHLKTAKQYPHRIAELAGTRAYAELSKLLKRPLAAGTPPDLSQASGYEKFVAVHRLALSPTIEGLDRILKRWDSLQIESVTEPVGGPAGVPALFAMFNVMKSDFLAARYLAFQALSDNIIPDSGSYSDTLDYAVYGVLPSMLALAQRACIDLLDKIAAAATEYFAIPGSRKNVSFLNRWFAKPMPGKPLAWECALSAHIRNGNTAIIALAELSLDVREGGALYQKKAYRHSSTHRFTVLHDLGCSPSRISEHIEHCPIDDFRSHVVESLQLARAALLYLVERISIAEASHAGQRRLRVPLIVPSHHSIRGEE